MARWSMVADHFPAAPCPLPRRNGTGACGSTESIPAIDEGDVISWECIDCMGHRTEPAPVDERDEDVTRGGDR